MTDKKLTDSGIAVLAALSDSDIFYVVANLGTTPATKKIESAAVKRAFDGWIPVTDSWTYATANTITVPAGATSIYQKGMKLRLKQGGAYKYFYITAVSSTLLTVTAGTDYTVANAAITDIAYSVASAPLGFPHIFACAAPTWDTATVDNGTGGQQPTAGTQFFSIVGNEVRLRFVGATSGWVKNGTGQLLTMSAIPATLPAVADAAYTNLGSAYTVANSVATPGVCNAGAAGVINLIFPSMTDNWTVPYTTCMATYKF